MAEKTHSVNLIVDRKDTVVQQFLTWTVSIGRLLIILVEMLALSVFLYRFSLDMQIVDLHDKINQASAIVKSFGKSETEFRNLQQRLAYAKRYAATADTNFIILQDIIKLGENIVTFKNILISQKSLEIEAQAPNANNLSLFTKKVKNYAKVSNLSVDKVENKASSALIVIHLSGGILNDTATVSAQSTTSSTTNQK